MSIPIYLCSEREVQKTKIEIAYAMKLGFEESRLQVVCSRFEVSKNQLIQEIVNKLLKKGFAIDCEHEAIKYISPIFLREETDGTQRLILNLKSFNKCVGYKHFKIQTPQTGLPKFSQLVTWQLQT